MKAREVHPRLRDERGEGFTISAPWSGGESAAVTFDLGGADAYSRWSDWTPEASNEEYGALVGTDGAALSFDVEPDERFVWDSGSLTITAADGSTLVIAPADGTAAGIDGPAFAITAGDGSTIVSQDTLPILCGERVGNGCRIGGDD